MNPSIKLANYKNHLLCQLQMCTDLAEKASISVLSHWLGIVVYSNYVVERKVGRGAVKTNKPIKLL